MQCVEIMSLAHKHKNNVYLQAATDPIALSSLFQFSIQGKAFPRSPGHFKGVLFEPLLPFPASLDCKLRRTEIEPLSRAISQLCVLVCVLCTACTCELVYLWTLSSLEQSLNSKRNSFLLRETQFSQIAFRAGGCKAFEVEVGDRKQQFICEQEKGTQESHNLSKIQFCSSFARRISSF